MLERKGAKSVAEKMIGGLTFIRFSGRLLGRQKTLEKKLHEWQIFYHYYLFTGL